MPAHPDQDTRARLIAVSVRQLAAAGPGAEPDLAAVAAAAGLPLEACTRCFPGPDDYRLALFQHLLDEARSAATQAAAEQTGALSLKRGIEAYLDTHLRYPALRELTQVLRSSEAGQAIIARRVTGFHRVLQVGLSSLHSLHPLASAQLLTALVVETAQSEYETQTPLPEMRETVYAYLDRLIP